MLRCVGLLLLWLSVLWRVHHVNIGTRAQGLLLVDDVLIKHDQISFSLHLMISKTDPYGKWVFVKICRNTPFCPVDTMLKYIQHRISQGAYSYSPLLADSNSTVLTRNRFYCLRPPSFD